MPDWPYWAKMASRLTRLFTCKASLPLNAHVSWPSSTRCKFSLIRKAFSAINAIPRSRSNAILHGCA